MMGGRENGGAYSLAPPPPGCPSFCVICTCVVVIVVVVVVVVVANVKCGMRNVRCRWLRLCNV